MTLELTLEQHLQLAYALRVTRPHEAFNLDEMLKVCPSVLQKFEGLFKEAEGKPVTTKATVELDDKEAALARMLWSNGRVVARDMPRTSELFDNIAAVTDALKE